MLKPDRRRFNRFVGGESAGLGCDKASSMWFKNQGSTGQMGFAGLRRDAAFPGTHRAMDCDMSLVWRSRRSSTSAKRWACNAKFTSSSDGPLASLPEHDKPSHLLAISFLLPCHPTQTRIKKQNTQLSETRDAKRRALILSNLWLNTSGEITCSESATKNRLVKVNMVAASDGTRRKPP